MTRLRPLGYLVAGVVATVAPLVTAPPAAATDSADRPAQPVPHTAGAGGIHQITRPGRPWPGVDDFGCRPTAEHPHPVILLHRTGANGVPAVERSARSGVPRRSGEDPGALAE